MKVFKFGGASIESIERAKNVATIIANNTENELLVVISAMGKTTNMLEQVVNHFCDNKITEAKSLFQDIEEKHNTYAYELIEDRNNEVHELLKNLYVEVDWILSDKPVRSYDYYYDQIVSIGELLSTTIISCYLNSIGTNNTWLDVRDLIKTDDTYRDATILWDITERITKPSFEACFHKSNIIITQGFIGCTDENASVTLGREGSDYSAAVFANMYNAESVTIWKDVPSLLNADPKEFKNTVAIQKITYHEVIEMAYYGAQVIHPKTIKPLYNKNIPLYVKCFLDTTLEGTCIQNTTEVIQYPPIYVLKHNQILLQVTTKDYSFITEDNLSTIYTMFHYYKIKINMIQNAAISFVCCIDNNTDKLEKLLPVLKNIYDVKRNEDVELLTIRHYTKQSIEEQTSHKEILLEQKTRSTIQFVVK